MSRENGRGTLFLTFCPFFTVFPALLLVLGAMSDTVQRWCLGSEDMAAGILSGCRNWCFLMLAAVALGIVLTLAVSILAARALRKRGGGLMDLLKMASIPLAAEVLLCGLMLKSEVLPLMDKVGPDLRQLEARELDSREVWFLPGSVETHLPGAFGPVKDLVQFQARGTDGEAMTVYIPACWSFKPEAAYQTAQDLDWNRENTPRYQLEITSRFCLSPMVPERVS